MNLFTKPCRFPAFLSNPLAFLGHTGWIIFSSPLVIGDVVCEVNDWAPSASRSIALPRNPTTFSQGQWVCLLSCHSQFLNRRSCQAPVRPLPLVRVPRPLQPPPAEAGRPDRCVRFPRPVHRLATPGHPSDPFPMQEARKFEKGRRQNALKCFKCFKILDWQNALTEKQCNCKNPTLL